MGVISSLLQCDWLMYTSSRTVEVKKRGPTFHTSTARQDVDHVYAQLSC